MLRQIKFINCRCFEESEIYFRNTAIIVGQNNAVKSTIVEALYNRITSLEHSLSHKIVNRLMEPIGMERKFHE